jgi:hypothetical protein
VAVHTYNPAFGQWRQDDGEVEASLGYMMSSKPALKYCLKKFAMHISRRCKESQNSVIGDKQPIFLKIGKRFEETHHQ